MADESRVLSLPMTAAYVRLIVRRFGSTRRRRAALLEGTGVSEDPPRDPEQLDAEISVATQLRQLATLDGIAEPGWGLELGAALDGVTHGPAGLVAVTAPSLGAALEALARYATVRTPFIDLSGSRAKTGYELRVLEPCHLGSVRTAVLEMVLLSIQGVVEAALGRRLSAAAFRMPAPRPEYWRRYTGSFHGPVTFAGRFAAVTLPAEWVALPCPLADRVAHRGARARLEALRQRLAGDFADAMVVRVLEGGDDAGAPLGEVARRLRLSPRTLVRRLAARGTSYRALLEEHRQRRAAELLVQPELTVAEISDRLGYDEPTNFARACRRWFGVSPRTYRARRRGRASIAAPARLG
jgi:AraC-like DNA-binding protein